ncbi:hypothetical protein SRCM100623_00947 [Acetobacter pasteurianus]|uniref:Protein NO VEIN C-terminal domain-containing protein n=1 Tax=Acetobacter pasteurianus TaxID=438 RepID=A0A1A0DAU6_ACEPA|nr:hypothetical protein [Acetobacter pasteurianus]OAZ72408.1 hypothetical protein SRCM100623_00947 [Acetobacter pasteurianus]
MGKASRDKGARRERQIVGLHLEAGVHAERVPLSGAMQFRNTASTDVDVYARGRAEAPFVCEVKARVNGKGFKTLEAWLGNADALFLIRDRQQPLVVLPWERWKEIISPK